MEMNLKCQIKSAAYATFQVSMSMPTLRMMNISIYYIAALGLTIVVPTYAILSSSPHNTCGTETLKM